MNTSISFKSFVGHRIREAIVHLKIFGNRQSPRLLMLPTYGPVQSSLLRVFNLVPELRNQGWTPLIVPAQLELVQRSRVLRRFDPDIVFLQKSRHPLNDPRFLEGRPYVYDIDDADFLDENLVERIEQTCRSAKAVIAGSQYVAEWCTQFNSNTHVVWTGAPISPGKRVPHADRQPILAWAQSDPNMYNKEFDFVEDIVTRLISEGVVFKLRLYGWRDGSPTSRLHRMRRAGAEIETIPFLPYKEFVRSLQDVAVGISPVIISSEFSRGKSFGKILAYLDAMVPVVASDEVDHAQFFNSKSGVLSNDPLKWVSEITSLLRDPQRRETISNVAFASFESLLSQRVAAQKVSNVMRSALSALDINSALTIPDEAH